MAETHDCLIWSFERGQWWKPNSRGYTELEADAGLYTLAQAREICERANIVKLNEAIVPVPALRKRP